MANARAVVSLLYAVMRTRTIQFIESRILQILSKVKNNKYPIYLSLCAMALNFAVESLQEQKDFDMALQNLLKRGATHRSKDVKGFNIYELAAKI